MRCIVRRWFAALSLALICGLSPVAAQNMDNQDLHPNAHIGIMTQPAPSPASGASDKPEKPAPTFSYFAAVVCAVVVLCLICVPSRKSESVTSH